MKKEISPENKLSSKASVWPEIYNKEARSPVIILCDHASNHIPAPLDGLGLDPAHLEQHIAWDIGAETITRIMCDMLDCSAIIHRVSRLVIDVNRDPSHATLIPVESDGIPVPGNRGLTAADCQQRIDAYHTPFHQATEALIQGHLDAGIIPMVVGMHSFTPTMAGVNRPWQIGFLWNKDPRLAQALIGYIERETDLTIGDNEPYSGKDLYYTMQRHGADRGLPQTTVEIRQDLVTSEAHCIEWAGLIAEGLVELQKRSDICQIKYYDQG